MTGHTKYMTGHTKVHRNLFLVSFCVKMTLLNLSFVFKKGIMAKKQNYIWKNDRNFALDNYEKQQLYYVVEANDIINKARHDLTARELKLMDFVISKIMPDDDKFHVIKTSMYELTKVLNIKQNGKNYADMAKSIGELRKRSADS